MEIDRIDDLPFGRAYKVYNDKETYFLPSVTTILKRNPQPWLNELEEALGPKKFQEVTVRGGRRGTVMHIYLELFIKEWNKNRDPEEALLYAQQAIKNHEDLLGWETKYPLQWKQGRDLFYNFYHEQFWLDIKEVLHSEIFMWSFFKGGWAGTTDFVYLNQADELIMEDFKSSSIPKDKDKIVNYFMQISAYLFMYAEMFGTLPKRGVIKITNLETHSMQTFTVEQHEFKAHLRKFLVLLEEFYQTQEWKLFLQTTKQS